MKRLIGAWLLGLLCATAHAAQDRQVFGFAAPASIDAPDVPAVMRDLAERVLPVYQDENTDRYLANLSALQWADSNYKAAQDTRRTLRERRADGPLDGQALLFDVYARARTVEATGSATFAQAFTQSFHELVGTLDDLDASAVTNSLERPPPPFRDAWRQALDRARGKTSIELPEATALIRAYFAYEAYRQLAPLAATLGADEDRRRYAVDDDVRIATPAGIAIHARIVRPKRAAAKLPTLLEFTLMPSPADARVSAAHGYVGVVAYTRGKFGTPDGAVVPFRYDGVDARAVIRWIAKQPWSDGRVGMYGDDYAGFAAWAATKSLPNALKAIATFEPLAPGISFPMQGHIFVNEALRWATVHARAGAAPADADDDARWQALDRQWYESGRPYRDLAPMAGLPRSVFRDWLHHPSYDHYWQRTGPFEKEFARIGIPVLTIAGCDTGGALHFYREHLRYRPAADHTLLLRPCDAAPATPIDVQTLRYQWFDHVFKNAAKPALLADRVNYRMPGTSEWRHVPSLAAMANGMLKLYPAMPAVAAGGAKSAAPATITQTVDLADRGDAAQAPPGDDVPARDGLKFSSEAFPQAVEVGGIVGGELDFIINKYDVDLDLTLYEQHADGRWLRIAEPHRFRASYARDDVDRHLLKAGVRQKLAFTSGRIAAHRLAAGSRLVAVLAVDKRRDRQINYGAGNDVSVESIADAKVPVEIRWYGDSHLDIPVRR
ncbi:MAG TPA: CocE/NonD family hydrolase [Solimonas sp.]|jgi:putative CocE/NonD family hydrolase|nr:CocE/NonD family hydrolase [Solimonas sp.]